MALLLSPLIEIEMVTGTQLEDSTSYVSPECDPAFDPLTRGLPSFCVASYSLYEPPVAHDESSDGQLLLRA